MTATTNPYANHKIPSSGAGGDMLKPEEGKAYKLRIVGEAVVYSSTYEGKPSTSYAMAVWNFTDEQPNIWRLPAGSFQQIVELANSEWGDPTKYNIMYKKTGTNLETRHSVQVHPNKDELTKEQLAQVEELDLKAVLEKFPSVGQVFTLSEANDGQYPAPAKDEGEPPITDDDLPAEFR